MEIITSVIIPTRSADYLEKTMADIYAKAHLPIEVIVIRDKPMRTAINEGVAKAQGKYIMKTDSHCMFDEGFDEKLIAEHQPNWVQVPRRKRLDPETWTLTKTDSPDIDYMLLCKRDLKGYKDNAKNLDPELKKILIDDTEIFQGSCYFMEKAYFNHLDLLDEVNFAGSGHEAAEIVMRIKQDGGRIIVNKKTWYAHWHKTEAKYRAKKDKSRKYIFELAKITGYGTHGLH